MNQFDLIVRNGRIIDGLGTPAYRADVGICDGKIVKIGDLKEHDAQETIDAKGLCVAPGFIDGHGHNDGILFRDPSAISKLSQGITTEISGNCGEGLAPVNPKYFPEISAAYKPYYPPDAFGSFTSFGRFLEAIDRLPLGIHVGFLCGHGILRMSTMGFAERAATKAEMEQMKTYLREALESGCLGMSTGLYYAPGCFSETEEIIELCKVLKEYGAVYTTHMRSESMRLLASIEETIRIAKESGVKVIISHLKALGKPQWGLAQQMLAKVEQANAEGCDIHFDQYPYSANCNVLSAILPGESQEGGVDRLIERLRNTAEREKIKARMRPEVTDWDNPVVNFGYDGIHILTADGTPDAVNKTLSEYAEASRQEPLDALFEVIINSGGAALAAYDGISERDLETIMQSPLGMIGTDGIAVLPHEQTHPRLYGAFPRVLARYVREKKLLTIEQAVHKMTALTAASLGIQKKGQIKVGYDADITVFDPDAILDTATFQNPQVRAEGIPYVIVGGKIALVRKEYTGAAGGVLLRKKGEGR